MKYVPLHIHTEYSQLDSIIKIPQLYEFASQNNMPAFAITDHGTMAGCADLFLTKSRIKDIKPIVGCEFYICEGEVIGEHTRKPRYHIVLLAKNQTGYQNLCKLISIASTQAYYINPRINHELLEQYKDGLICLSACMQGELASKFLSGDNDGARERAKYYKDLFGADYYIELQDHSLEAERKACEFLIEIAKEFGIKTVITNDSHYLRKADADAHDDVLCEQSYSDKNDPNRYRFPNKEFYVKTVDELKQAFSWMDENYFNQCIETTLEIADKCNFEMEFDNSEKYMPKVSIEELLNWAKENNIPIGEVNETKSAIKIEISADRCELLISDYICQKFGENCVARIESSDEQHLSLVITPIPVENIIPIRLSNYGELTTQYSKEEIEKIGLFRIDFVKNRR